MALSAAGIGSGLDITSLVSQLVSAERTPAANRLSTRQTTLNSQISSLGMFKSVMADLQTQAKNLKADGAFSKLTVTSSAPTVFTASASGAVAGNYDIEVVSLAKAHKLVSGTYSGADAVIGSGDVTLTVGDKSFTVTLDDEANTLGYLRDAINKAGNNTGVTATLVHESGGTRLMLSSQKTGSDSVISVSGGGLAFTERQAAVDAHIRVEGYDHYASSNDITGAIDGVTINLLKADPGNTATLNAVVDNKAATAAIETFVKSYNTALATMATVTRYDAATKSGAALTGDVAVRGAAQSVRSVMNSVVNGAGSFAVLSEIGITTATDGTLKIDSAKLSKAMASDYAGVQSLFGSSEGYAAKLSGAIEGLLGDEGRIASKDTALKAQLKDISKQQEKLDERMTRLEARYKAQFIALDSLMSKMGSTSDYLTQQLASLANLR